MEETTARKIPSRMEVGIPLARFDGLLLDGLNFDWMIRVRFGSISRLPATALCSTVKA
jgi:hypothetical protein